MKHYLLLGLIILVNFNSISQTFAPIGAEWIMGYIEPMTFNEHGYRTLTVVGDTVINGQDSRIILGDVGPHSPSLTNKNFVYEDGGKVYAYFDQINIFQKVFDFDAPVGHSWDIVIHEAPTNAVFDSMEITIDSIFTEILDGDSIKSYTYSILFKPNEGSQCPNLYDSTMFAAYDLKANNKLGAGHYLFPVPTVLCVADIYENEWHGQLRCYTDLTMTYSNLGIGIPHCNYQNISIEELNHNSVILEYNKWHNKIHILNDNEESGHIEIYDYKGRLLLSEKGKVINISSLEKGLYIAQYLRGDKRGVLKFIH